MVCPSLKIIFPKHVKSSIWIMCETNISGNLESIFMVCLKDDVWTMIQNALCYLSYILRVFEVASQAA